MKKIKKIIPNLYHVISEPGNMTRYDYFVFLANKDDFSFMSGQADFRYPQILEKSIYSLESMKNLVSLISIARIENCDVDTFIECIKTMHEEDIQYEEIVYDSDLSLYPYNPEHFGGSEQS